MAMSEGKELAVYLSIIDTIREMKNDGAPGGVLYVFVMEQGGDMPCFERIMAAVKSTGLVECKAHLWRWIGPEDAAPVSFKV